MINASRAAPASLCAAKATATPLQPRLNPPDRSSDVPKPAQPAPLRAEALLRLIAKRRGDGILFNDALAAEGNVVFAKACELGLQGIVSKRAGSFYKSGPSRNWLKTKNPDFVRT